MERLCRGRVQSTVCGCRKRPLGMSKVWAEAPDHYVRVWFWCREWHCAGPTEQMRTMCRGVLCRHICKPIGSDVQTGVQCGWGMRICWHLGLCIWVNCAIESNNGTLCASGQTTRLRAALASEIFAYYDILKPHSKIIKIHTLLTLIPAFYLLSFRLDLLGFQLFLTYFLFSFFLFLLSGSLSFALSFLFLFSQNFPSSLGFSFFFSLSDFLICLPLDFSLFLSTPLLLLALLALLPF